MKAIVAAATALALIAATATAAETCAGVDYPIVDIHVHGYGEDERLSGRVPNPGTGVPSAATDAESHRRLTLSELRRMGIVRAIVSSEDLAHSEAIITTDPARIRLGYEVDGIPTAQDLARMRELHREGKLELIGEIAPQYTGVAPNDPRLSDFWSMAEELQIPVGYHMGSGPPDIVYSAAPQHRASLGDPLLIEEVLVRHPRLKLFIMHGGFPYADNMQALMSAYPRVHMDLGAIHWFEKRSAFHAYLRRMMEAGFGRRIMFGSDQMTWPEAIGQSVEAYREAAYLTDENRRDIFFNNAVRFFGWEDLATCSKLG